MSSRYRYNSQSFYNRSTGGQTNNPRVINRPYGVGTVSNRSNEIKTMISNIAHAGYYVNDSIESMANQLIRSGYYVSQEPPQTKILITGFSLPDSSRVYDLNSMTYTSSSRNLNFTGVAFYIHRVGTSSYEIGIKNNGASSTVTIAIPADSYYYYNTDFISGVAFYNETNDVNVHVLTLTDSSGSDNKQAEFTLSQEYFQFDLPNN